ncbi:MAG TPA: hypothetical protein VMY42_07870 [Thermoguttaceae bacterium]|nr:hypothetical protein [Thermoguttaceae bacterium]
MRKNLLWALAVVVLVSFAECGSGSETKTNRGNGDTRRTENENLPNLSFIPEDCFCVVFIHPRRIIYSSLARELPQDVVEDLLRAMGRVCWGIDPRKIEEDVVLRFPGRMEIEIVPLDLLGEPIGEELAPPIDYAHIMRFSEPIANMELLRNNVLRYYKFAHERATHAGKEYHRVWYSWNVPSGRQYPNQPADFAVHFPDAHTVVFSDCEAVLKRMLSADGVKSGLVQRLSQLDADNDWVAAITFEGSGEACDRLADDLRRELPTAMSGLLTVSDLGSAVTFTADLHADPVAQLTVVAKDADSAARLKELFANVLTACKASFGNERDDIAKQLPPGAAESVVELVEEVLDGITVTEDGEKVIATLKKPKVLAKLLTSLAEVQRERQDRLERHARTPGQVGMIVVYEVDVDKPPPGSKLSDTEMRVLTAAIGKRLNPGERTSGRIRQLDDGRIEVSIFRMDLGVMQRTADLLSRPGTLEFRILANNHDHLELIERAKAESDSRTVHDEFGNTLAWWVPVRQGRQESVQGFEGREIATRMITKDSHNVLEVLVVKDKFDVNGSYVKRAVADTDPLGEPCVVLTWNEAGARLFAGLTGSNLPDRNSGFRRKLGIIIDGELYSAPGIVSTVSKEAWISGRFTQEEVQDLVDLLNAGALPTAIRKTEQRVVDVEKQRKNPLR